jgi:hypothetical protein
MLHNARPRNRRNGCGVCTRARGVLQAAWSGKKATVAHPALLIQLIEWAEK